MRLSFAEQPGGNGTGSLCPTRTRLIEFVIHAINLPITLNQKANLVDPVEQLGMGGRADLRDNYLYGDHRQPYREAGLGACCGYMPQALRI